MKNGDPFLYLDRMVDACRWALEFTEGFDEASFLADDKTRSAVAMQLIVIGESSGRLAREFPDFARERFGKSLGDMVGMRNRIAHGYHDLNFQTVWLTVEGEIAELLQLLRGIYEAEGEPFPGPQADTSGQS